MCEYCDKIKFKKYIIENDRYLWRDGITTTSPAISIEDVLEANIANGYSYCPKCGKPI